MTYGDVLTREAAWFQADVAGLPPLLVGVGDDTGPFEVVEPFERRAQQKDNQLFLWRERTLERPLASGGWRQWDHIVVAMILWERRQAASKAQIDLAALDLAVERVMTRVRGPANDKTHGGRFDQAGHGEITVEYPEGRNALDLVDAPLSAANAFVVLVRYPITESVSG